MFLRFLASVPLSMALVPYLAIRYPAVEQRVSKADAWGEKIKDWVVGKPKI